MPRLLPLFLLLACTGEPGDTGAGEPSVVLASPAFTPEVGEEAEYDALFVDGLPDRVEWFVDEERVSFEPLSGQERATLALIAPAEAFTLRVDAFHGVESVSDSLAMTALPNTAPAVALTSPTASNFAPGELIELIASVDDRTTGEVRCTALVGGTEIRSGVADGGVFGATWIAVEGTWSLEVRCTDALDLPGSASATVEVR